MFSTQHSTLLQKIENIRSISVIIIIRLMPSLEQRCRAVLRHIIFVFVFFSVFSPVNPASKTTPVLR